ncbi:MAG TPA: DUF58 domain-containing protein [Gammaproteobacteria bacterium]|nr:DUF58 domain-containing protein [Gammaproteobacteria bacterium]
MALSLAALPHRLYRLFRIERRRAGRHRPVVLSQQRIYILPTRYGLLYAFLVFLLTLGATNYNNNTAFILSFLLMGLGMVAALHTYGNLAGLRFRSGRTFHVFCGEAARYTVYADNPRTHSRHAVALQLEDQPPVHAELAPRCATEVELNLPARHRGYQPLTTLTVATRFPLGLFRAWSRVRLEMNCLVYPRPAEAGLPPRPAPSTSDGRPAARAGNDDFLGHRRYQPSDSPRHVDWKAAARGRELLTKQFSNQENEVRWFDWDSLEGLDEEARLSQLCRWVLDAEEASFRYGLRLPGIEIPVNRGDAHKHRCLEALALYPEAP